jgi:hypothetical protein
MRRRHLNIRTDRLFGRQADGILKGASENPADAQVDEAPVSRQQPQGILFLFPYQVIWPAI